MKHRTLALASSLILALWLCGCDTLILAVDPAAMEQEVAMRVDGTLTAQAPTPTATPTETALPTQTPAPTSTPPPTATPTPKPTNTRRPTATATSVPTAVPVQVPESWVHYEGFTKVFSVYHPTNWRVESEGGHSVFLKAKTGSASMSIFLTPEVCDMTSEDTEQVSRCLAEHAGDLAAILTLANKYVARETWSAGGVDGYVVEQVMTDRSTSIYTRLIYVPIEQDVMVMVVYLRPGSKTITARDQEIVDAIAGSFRVNGPLSPDTIQDWEETLPL
ncbi:MAG: hypothetical protein ACYC5M_08995 [Anaerolineae bacterium]